MKKLLLVLLVLCSMVIGQNTTGWFYTDDVDALVNGGGTVYSSAFDLSSNEDVRAVIKLQDTTQAGFANDSIDCIWGYQTGTRTLGTDNIIGTVWSEPLIYLDTIAASQLGASVGVGSVDATGALTRSSGASLDTTNATGGL